MTSKFTKNNDNNNNNNLCENINFFFCCCCFVFNWYPVLKASGRFRSGYLHY